MSTIISAHFQKRDTAVLDYQVDWSDWLIGDTISASSWTVASGLTKDSDVHTSTSATVWLSGGTVGQTYEVVNTITTAAGRTDYRTLLVEVIE